MAGSPQPSAAEEQALIDGFFDRGGAEELRLLEALRPTVRRLVKRRWPALWPQVDDLVQSLFLQLFTLRGKELRIDPPLIEAVSTILNQEAKELLSRQRRSAQLPDELGGAFASPDAALDGKRLLALIGKLPDDQAAVLLHQAAEVQGEGPPLHEALGVTPELARKRLAYARKLLYGLAYPNAATEAADG